MRKEVTKTIIVCDFCGIECSDVTSVWFGDDDICYSCLGIAISSLPRVGQSDPTPTLTPVVTPTPPKENAKNAKKGKKDDKKTETETLPLSERIIAVLGLDMRLPDEAALCESIFSRIAASEIEATDFAIRDLALEYPIKYNHKYAHHKEKLQKILTDCGKPPTENVEFAKTVVRYINENNCDLKNIDAAVQYCLLNSEIVVNF